MHFLHNTFRWEDLWYYSPTETKKSFGEISYEGFLLNENVGSFHYIEKASINHIRERLIGAFFVHAGLGKMLCFVLGKCSFCKNCAMRLVIMTTNKWKEKGKRMTQNKKIKRTIQSVQGESLHLPNVHITN